MRLVILLVGLLLLVWVPPSNAGVGSGQKCSKSSGPDVTACIDIRGNTPYALLTNNGKTELCGDLSQKLTTTEYGGRTDTYERIRMESGCLPPGETWEVDFSPIDTSETTHDPYCNPYSGGDCPQKPKYTGMCVEAFRTGQSISRYVCR